MEFFKSFASDAGFLYAQYLEYVNKCKAKGKTPASEEDWWEGWFWLEDEN